MNWYDFLLRNRGEVIQRTGEHIELVAAAMAIAAKTLRFRSLMNVIPSKSTR